jgi:hypothetical protein
MNAVMTVGKKVSVNSYTISAVHLHYRHIASQFWPIPAVFTIKQLAC